MASTIIAHLFNNIEIAQRSHDGYIDATAMCKASSKLLADYLRLKSTNEYLGALSENMGIPITALVMVSRGGNADQHTYVHPEVAVDLGKWCCVQLRILVNRWVVEWSTNLLSPNQHPLSSGYGTSGCSNLSIPIQFLKVIGVCT